MNPTWKAIPPLAIAASGVVLAQLAGVGFWIGMAGVGLGWLASLTWEAASVWLWWRGDRGRVLRLAKWTATGALMFGMLAETAGPVAQLALEEFGREGTGREVLAILKAQADAGHWTSQTTLKRAMEAAEASPWLPALKALGAAVLFPALYAIALVALATAGKEWREGRGEVSTGNGLEKPADGKFPKAKAGNKLENWNNVDGLASELAALIRTRWPNGTKMAVIEHETSIGVRDLSLLLNHEKNKAANGRTHGMDALRGIAAKLEK